VELSDGAWADKRCFIVGGGPSLQGFDWNLLRRQHETGAKVVVVNRAYRDAPYADVFLTEDARVIQAWAHRQDWRAFDGHKLLALMDVGYRADVERADPSVKIIQSCDKRHGWPTTLEQGVSTSSNSGIPALSLADILGANPIYLLGFDCRDDDGRMNFHSDYPDKWRTNKHQLESFRSDFRHWAKLGLDRSGKQVINLVDGRCLSKLDCWPRWDRDTFLLTGNPATVWEPVKA
jgi:hypothetical protein